MLNSKNQLPLDMMRREVANLFGVPQQIMFAVQEYHGDRQCYHIGFGTKNGSVRFFVDCEAESLDLSLNDFSERYLKPAVEGERSCLN